DLGDDAVRRLLDDPAGELAADDAQVAERLAGAEPPLVVEQGEPRRGAAAARRAIDLAVGEDGDVPLGERLVALLLPEDDPVEVAQLGLPRMDDLVVASEVRLDRAAELDQPRELARLDALRQRGVERAAERDVDAAARGLQAPCVYERGDVAEADRDNAAVRDPRGRRQATGGRVDDDLRPGDAAALDRPRDERDRPVAARGRVAGVVEEDDAEVRPVVLRLGDVAAVHVGVPARLVDEQPPDAVQVLRGVAPLVEDALSRDRLDAAGDDPEGLPAGVVVDRPDQRPVKRGSRFSRKAATPSRKSSVFVAALCSSASSASCSSSVAVGAASKRRFVSPIPAVGPAAYLAASSAARAGSAPVSTTSS